MKATYVGPLTPPMHCGSYVEFHVTASLPATGLAKDSPAPARGSYGSLDAVCDETSMGTCGPAFGPTGRNGPLPRGLPSFARGRAASGSRR